MTEVTPWRACFLESPGACHLHTDRSATIGSVFEARRAGRKPATVETVTSSIAVPANESASVGPMP